MMLFLSAISDLVNIGLISVHLCLSGWNSVQFLEVLPSEEQTGILQETSSRNCQNIISKWKLRSHEVFGIF